VKTFPDGGYWKGKNYLFDRRSEQVPGAKDDDAVERETPSKCCLCRCKWTKYRGKFKCAQSATLCGVPVIVCESCRAEARARPDKLMCELCRQGYKAPSEQPDLVGTKRKAEERAPDGPPNSDVIDADAIPEERNHNDATSNSKKPKHGGPVCYEDRLFFSRLPLTVTKTKLVQAMLLLLGSSGSDDDEVVVKIAHWLTDRRTGGFYGSAIVQLGSSEIARKILTQLGAAPMKIDKKKIRVNFVRRREDGDGVGDAWPPLDYVDREYPPLGNYT